MRVCQGLFACVYCCERNSQRLHACTYSALTCLLHNVWCHLVCCAHFFVVLRVCVRLACAFPELEVHLSVCLHRAVAVLCAVCVLLCTALRAVEPPGFNLALLACLRCVALPPAFVVMGCTLLRIVRDAAL